MRLNYYCYQCGVFDYLFTDSRCIKCTRSGPEKPEND